MEAFEGATSALFFTIMNGGTEKAGASRSKRRGSEEDECSVVFDKLEMESSHVSSRVFKSDIGSVHATLYFSLNCETCCKYN